MPIDPPGGESPAGTPSLGTSSAGLPSVGTPRAPRADARRNRDRVLEAAAEVVAEQGTQASLRDVARRAEVGLGTLYRHFPTREALLEALLHHRFEQLAERADALAASAPPPRALTDWLYEFTLGASAYQGLPATLMATLADEESPLHAACVTMRRAGGRLLEAAQADGGVRRDVTAVDLFTLVNALSWATDQAPALAERREHLFGLVMDGLKPR
ncbi:helix-turn-helix transcriptional regulator [Kitasatospora sp. RG8]|uniref:TetR/AcrR family transcriptional regulator n=1 Tax=Kitasatospora sp. RG8 TaxID=2820815 RepID=UPI001AE0E2CB|nr:TetR/AcrR family transcriptional regulator [Kitasatospora sp. RG8]MBP0448604.1 helix-turn-helix transcriptional regulator [Kitasatospora sp. RG8]